MNRKAIDWVDFLNTDPFQKFGIKQDSSQLSPRIPDYLPAEEFKTTYAAWMNDQVTKVWHRNWVDAEGFTYHLLEVDC